MTDLLIVVQLYLELAPMPISAQYKKKGITQTWVISFLYIFK